MRIYDLGDEIRDSYIPTADEDLPYIGLEHIEPESLHISQLGSSGDVTSQKFRFKAGDILFGTLRPYFRKVVKPNFDGICSTEFSVIRAKSDDDSNYLLYVLANDRFIEYATTNSKGARPRTKWKLYSDFEIKDIEPATRSRIGNQLANYDDLIENNRRRIQLLEQSARLLYKEWFVHLRFPGHEHVKIVDGIPEGWTTSTVADVCKEYSDGDWIETKDQGGEDYRLLQISNIGLNEFIETGNFRYITEDTFRRLRCNEIVPGDILISRMPTPIGRGWLVTEMPWRMITAVDGAIARPDPDQVDKFYYLYFINSPQHIGRCEARATGATRPRISRKIMGSLPILIPERSLQLMFGDFAAGIHAQKTNLRRQNALLENARDLLLPRLMNGEIAV